MTRESRAGAWPRPWRTSTRVRRAGRTAYRLRSGQERGRHGRSGSASSFVERGRSRTATSRADRLHALSTARVEGAAAGRHAVWKIPSGFDLAGAGDFKGIGFGHRMSSMLTSGESRGPAPAPCAVTRPRRQSTSISPAASQSLPCAVRLKRSGGELKSSAVGKAHSGHRAPAGDDSIASDALAPYIHRASCAVCRDRCPRRSARRSIAIVAPKSKLSAARRAALSPSALAPFPDAGLMDSRPSLNRKFGSSA